MGLLVTEMTFTLPSYFICNLTTYVCRSVAVMYENRCGAICASELIGKSHWKVIGLAFIVSRWYKCFPIARFAAHGWTVNAS